MRRTKTVRPYGSWKSPIDIDLVLAKSVTLSEPRYCNGELFWLEGRPHEGGRKAICRRSADGTISDVLLPYAEDQEGVPNNARTVVHEYGGGSYVVSIDDVFFANFDGAEREHSDQRLYRSSLEGGMGKLPKARTPHGLLFADMQDDFDRGRLICVAEDHRGGEVTNFLAAVNQYGSQEVTTLASGFDFYASPILSPDGNWLAWVCWNHPNMPWDDTELWLAKVGLDGQLHDPRKIAGGVGESVLHPRFSPAGDRLYFMSDRSNWWNIYQFAWPENASPIDWPQDHPTFVTQRNAEFCGPMWVLGQSPYAVLSDGRIAAAYKEKGRWNLQIINPAGGFNEHVYLPYTDITDIVAGENSIALIAASSTSAPVLIEVDLATHKVTVVRESSDLQIDAGYISVPKLITVPTTPMPGVAEANGPREVTYGLFYAPKNRDYKAPEGELPPLRVLIHGGPTSGASHALRYPIQYWTSRGVAVVDVDYRGSTGYGRAYRKKLAGNWGIVDWQDCEAVAKYLSARGLVDGKREAIEGGSAGGFTTLAALAFGSVFTAGCSRYGVSDLTALAQETHKFESRYLDGLIGRYPEDEKIYIERSPLHAAANIRAPLLVLQGEDDKIVPPKQAALIVEALRFEGVPVAAIYFEREGHGFRKAANIKRSLLAEYSFLAQVFGFEPADAIEKVAIEYMPGEGHQGTSEVTYANAGNFDQVVLGADKPVLVDWFTDWCGPCKFLAPFYRVLAVRYWGLLQFVKINVEKPGKNKPLALSHGVDSYPRLQLFNGGKMIVEKKGGGSYAQLTAWIDGLCQTCGLTPPQQGPLGEDDFVAAVDAATAERQTAVGPAREQLDIDMAPFQAQVDEVTAPLQAELDAGTGNLTEADVFRAEQAKWRELQPQYQPIVDAFNTVNRPAAQRYMAAVEAAVDAFFARQSAIATALAGDGDDEAPTCQIGDTACKA
jgi:dipeptidyl aminopeptidase/acylaminoacyl peptidase/thioredoxin-like negative regulator of GroEL